MVFLWFPMFIHFPIGFPLIFRFSHGFSHVFPIKYGTRLTRDRLGIGEAQVFGDAKLWRPLELGMAARMVKQLM